MKKSTSIKLKAAFLLAIFALNTVVGFACSVGMDMGFNTKHHDEDVSKEVVHIHKDGKRHVHGQGHGKPHGHHQKANANKEHHSGPDNCCNGKVRAFEQVDKSLPQSLKIIHPVFATAFLASFYNLDLITKTEVVKDIKQFVRSDHPPIPDIRISIQSFQI